ncbi:MAG: alpha/beta fold hydrolase [Bacteroidia bacterium]
MEFYYKSYGKGPALVILHGLFGSLDNWVTHARQLAEDYSVYLFDARNHGRSEHLDAFDYDVMADDLETFLDEHGIIQAHLLGHSMGGKTVMNFAGKYPERIDKLIVADMGIREYPPHHNIILDAIRSITPSEFSSRQEVDKVLEEKGIPEVAVRQFLLKSLGRDKAKQLAWKFNFPVIDEHYAEILKPVELDVPYDGDTLMLYGGASHYVQEKDFEDILIQFPEARFQAIAGAGHWLHAEKPKPFLEAVQSYLGNE